MGSGISTIILHFLVTALCLAGGSIKEAHAQPDYANAMKDFLRNQEYASDFHNPGQVRFELAYIDEDDVPELLLCEGTGHIDGIVIYKYNPDTERMEMVDSFSSFGRFGYAPRLNIVKSSYGNHGYFAFVFTKIEKDFTVTVTDALSEDGGGVHSEEIRYYHGMDSDTYHGTYYEMPKKPISEKEYDRLLIELMGGQEKTVGYNEMTAITEENVEGIW